MTDFTDGPAHLIFILTYSDGCDRGHSFKWPLSEATTASNQSRTGSQGLVLLDSISEVSVKRTKLRLTASGHL